MLFFNIEKSSSDFLVGDEAIKYVWSYFKSHNFLDLPVGNYKTTRPEITYRIDEYTSEIAELRYWQAHRHHLDIYILLRGQERIDVGQAADFRAFHYDATDDVSMLEEGQISQINYLRKYGDCLICFPQEPHKTGMHVDLKQSFKVVLFKIELATERS